MKKHLYLNESLLKIFGIVFMTFDHIGAYIISSGFAPDNSPLYWTAYVFRIIGRLALPLFLFFLAEGMRKTHDRTNYLLRLALIWAPILIVDLILYFLSPSLSQAQAFTDLLVCGLFVFFLEKKGWMKTLAAIPAIYVGLSFAANTYEMVTQTATWTVYFPLFLRADYSLYGFLIFLGFYYAYPIIDKWLKGNVLLGEKTLEEYKETPDYRWTVNIFNFTIFVVINVVFWAIYHFLPAADYLNMGIQTYSILAGLFLLFYNGKRGYDKKWFRYFTYLYYPVHIALIALIFWLI